jgi:hypothetical protein
MKSPLGQDSHEMWSLRRIRNLRFDQRFEWECFHAATQTEAPTV